METPFHPTRVSTPMAPRKATSTLSRVKLIETVYEENEVVLNELHTEALLSSRLKQKRNETFGGYTPTKHPRPRLAMIRRKLELEEFTPLGCSS